MALNFKIQNRFRQLETDVNGLQLGTGGVNLWKAGVATNLGEFNTNDNTLSNITELTMNSTNSLGQDVTNYLNKYIGKDSLILELINTTDKTNNGKYSVTSVQNTVLGDYRNFSYAYRRIFGDDASINQLIIFETTANPTISFSTDTDEDDLRLDDLAASSIIAYTSLYGNSDVIPIDISELDNYFKRFVDNVLYNGAVLATISEMRDNFTNNYSTIRGSLPLYSNFEFPDDNNYNESPTGGTGSDFEVEIKYENDGYNVTIDSAGTGYSVSDILTVSGDELDGNSPENDLVITVTTIGGAGEITGFTHTGLSNYLDADHIDDGGNDQYDDGNYLNNEYNEEINYGKGEIIDDVFGVGSKYFCGYRDSIFTMIATENTSDSFYLSGNTGSDGDGGTDGDLVKYPPTEFELDLLYATGIITNGKNYEINILKS